MCSMACVGTFYIITSIVPLINICIVISNQFGSRIKIQVQVISVLAIQLLHTTTRLPLLLHMVQVLAQPFPQFSWRWVVSRSTTWMSTISLMLMVKALSENLLPNIQAHWEIPCWFRCAIPQAFQHGLTQICSHLHQTLLHGLLTIRVPVMNCTWSLLT